MWGDGDTLIFTRLGEEANLWKQEDVTKLVNALERKFDERCLRLEKCFLRLVDTVMKGLRVEDSLDIVDEKVEEEDLN